MYCRTGPLKQTQELSKKQKLRKRQVRSFIRSTSGSAEGHSPVRGESPHVSHHMSKSSNSNYPAMHSQGRKALRERDAREATVRKFPLLALKIGDSARTHLDALGGYGSLTKLLWMSVDPPVGIILRCLIGPALPPDHRRRGC